MQKNCGASAGNMWLCVTGEISMELAIYVSSC